MANQTPYEAFLKFETGTHSALIRQVLVTPDNKSLITASEDKTIRVWDIESRKPTRLILGQIGTGPQGTIQRIAQSPDGNHLAVLAWMYPDDSESPLDRYSELRLYNLSTANLQAGYVFRGTLQDLDFSSNGKYLVIAGNKNKTGYIYLYDIKKVLKGFGNMPQELASGVLHETNSLIPSYVRFIPDTKRKSDDLGIVAATWLSRTGAGNDEYAGKLVWFSYSPKGGLVKNLERFTEEQLEPESLTASNEHVIITAHAEENKKFYCYDQSGNLLSVNTSETKAAQPAFSKDGKYLIVGQHVESHVVQVKVYSVLRGQFHLKSTYYGHDSKTGAVALLENGTAVSAGGDQNEIHLWRTDHLEGERIALFSSLGRTIHGLGVNNSDQIGIGTHRDLKLDDGRIALQRIFDLRSMTLRSSNLQDEQNYSRSQTQYDGLELNWENVNLWLKSDSFSMPLTGIPHPKRAGTWIWYHATTFGFTEKGSIITGASDGKIRVATRGSDGGYSTPLRLLGGFGGRVNDHASSKKWLVTGGADQFVRLWFLEDVESQNANELDPDQATLEPALNLFIGSDDEWVIWSKNGYYNASQRGDRRFGYHINRGFQQEAIYIPSDRFIKSFFRPDIISAIVELGSEERALAALRKSEQAAAGVDVASVLPPVVEISGDGFIPSKDWKKATVEFSVEKLHPNSTVKRVWIVQNDRFAWEQTGKKLDKKYKITLPLAPGDNRFKILAETESTKSMPLIRSVTGPEPKAQKAGVRGTLGSSRGGDKAAQTDTPNTVMDIKEAGTLFLLAVGVSEFSDTSGKVDLLKYADDDARGIFNAFGKGDLSDRLQTRGKSETIRTESKNKAFESVEATILTNQFATKKAILDEVKRIGEKIEKRARAKKPKRDVFMMFLSGHGVRLVGGPIKDLYYWNYDARFFELEKTGLSFMELGEKITSLPAEVVLATDACHSGMAGREVVRELDANELAKLIYAINERGLYILNAARGEEKAREIDEVRHGIFARSILDALNKQADPDISMIGLMDFVQRQMRIYMGIHQTPVFRTYGDLLPLIIYNK